MRRIPQAAKNTNINKVINQAEDNIYTMLKSFATNHPKKFLCLGGITGAGGAAGYVYYHVNHSNSQKMEERLAALEKNMEKSNQLAEKNSFNISELRMEFVRYGYFTKPSLSELLAQGVVTQSQLDHATSIALEQEKAEEKVPSVKGP